MLVLLKAKDAISVCKAYARALQKLPKEIANTLTDDQGKEMSEHKQFTIDTGIQVLSSNSKCNTTGLEGLRCCHANEILSTHEC